MEHSDYSDSPIGDTDLVSWPRVAAISAMVSLSLPTFITGIEIYQALSIHDAVWALLIGSAILTLIGGAMGTIGAKTRMSSYLLVRIAFGDTGASIVNLAFALSLLGWFGVNIDLFSDAVMRLTQSVFGVELPVYALEIAAGLCMITTTIYGFRAINILSAVLVPIMLFVTISLLIGASESLTLDAYWHINKHAELSLSDGVGAIVGVIIIGAIILPDITRFSRQTSGGFHTAFWSYGVVELFVLFVAGFAAAAMGQTEVLSLMLDLGIGLSAFVIVIAGSWILNSLNLYSTVLSMEATFPRLAQKDKNKVVALTLGLLGIVAAFFNFLDMFLSFLAFLAGLFVPVAGVILVDYFFINQSAYHYSRLSHNLSVNKAALLAWLIGACVPLFYRYAQTPVTTGIEVLDAIFVAGLMYWVVHRFVPHRHINFQER